MRKELEKYGIQMPSFSKIGGILANELSVDEAARKTLTSGPAIHIRLTYTLLVLVTRNRIFRRYFKPL